MILAFVIVASALVIAAKLGMDVLGDYLQSRKVKQPKITSWATPEETEVKKGIAAYRNCKKIELGLAKVQERNIQPRRSQRKLQAS